MGGRSLLLAGAALIAACRPVPELPREIHIDDRATETDREIIVAMIAEHNRGFGRLHGGPVYLYAGLHQDPDGFSSRDFDDGRMVVYVLYDQNNAHERLYRERHDRIDGNTTVGYGTLSDILLMRYKLPDNRQFSHTTLHELGHGLGLGHMPQHPMAVMYPTNNGITTLSIHDERTFCELHPCEIEPAPPDSNLPPR